MGGFLLLRSFFLILPITFSFRFFFFVKNSKHSVGVGEAAGIAIVAFCFFTSVARMAGLRTMHL